MKVYRRRLASIILNNKCDAFKLLSEEDKKYRSCCQDIANRIRSLMMNDQLLKRVFGRNELCVVKDSNLYNSLKDHIEEKEHRGEVLFVITRAKLVQTLFKDIFDKYGFVEKGIANYKRSIVEHTINRFNGFKTRNKKGKKVKNGGVAYICFKKDVIHISEGLKYDKEKQQVTIPYSGGKLTIPIYRYIAKGEVAKNFGANIMFKYDKKNRVYAIVVRPSIEFFEEPAYLPDGFLGFDINESKDYWITMSDGKQIARPQEMTDLMDQKKILNYEISNTNKQAKIKLQDGTVTVLRTKERRKRRQQLEPILKKIKNIAIPYAKQVIDKAISENKGLAIDKINPGAGGSGEFGQVVSDIIIQMCEDNAIPFYVIPSPYTSMTCSKCGSIDKQNRNGHKFSCINCNHSDNSHCNAANNMVVAAEKLYTEGAMFMTCERNAKSLKMFKMKSDKMWDKYNKKQQELILIESN